MLVKRALSIPDFCESFGLSRSMFYKLKEKGLIPTVMKIGRRRLISNEAIRDWEKKMQDTE